MKRGGQNRKSEETVITIPRASVNLTSFRMLITGPEDVVPVLARQLKNCLNDKFNITDLKIHHTVALNEEIAKKLSKDGLHAVVLCTDPSTAMTNSNVKETVKRLDFNLLSSSTFILNLLHPKPATYPSVMDTLEKLSTVYKMHSVNILYEDKESVKFGLYRIATVALRSSKFVYGDCIQVFSCE